jgi:hypothetical protein
MKGVLIMNITPVQGSNVKPEAVKDAPKQQVNPVKPQNVRKKDTTFISEKAKDLAAKLSGTQFAEEAKESTVVKAKEEMTKSIL